MVKQRGSNTKPWGTLEELLLASAVNRHGTTRWDSVAMELHNRCSQSPSSLTPQDCRNKFYDLKRRFVSENDEDSASLMPMMEELRKIRVEELRRDVQRRDVLIVSLEMKVKRLEEERERSSKEGEGGADLKADAGKENLRPDSKTEDRENRSLNESNSTSKKDDVEGRTETVKITKKKETGPIRTGGEPGREWSTNGAAAEPERERNWRGSEAGAGGGVGVGVGDSNDAGESVSESKQEGKEGALSKQQQQSSDVQSSATLSLSQSHRKRCRNSSGEDPEVSPANPIPSPLKSEPFLKFLDIIRSHRLASPFERRLRTQESDRYKKLIRQHIDLRTIHSRVVKGAYADSIHRFFRDLLLLFNNAIIFFHRSSTENGAAVKLRALVLKEMKDKIRKLQPQPIVAKSKPKQEPDLSSRPTKPSSIVGCRKRESVALLSDVGAKKAEKNSRDVEGKPKVVADASEIKIYEKGTWKKGLKERPRPAPAPAPAAGNSGPRNSRTTTGKNNGEVKHEYGGNELSSHDGMEVGKERKERVRKKKQGAVSFLKRMKQNSPSEATDEDVDASEDESLKEEEEEAEEEEEEVMEEKKKKKMKMKMKKQKKEGRGERVTRSAGGGGGRGGRGESGRGKRGVGRPPKKAEAVTVTVTVKRQQREEVVGGSGGGIAKPRKRSRR